MMILKKNFGLILILIFLYQLKISSQINYLTIIFLLKNKTAVINKCEPFIEKLNKN